MIRLGDVLTPQDREHISKILEGDRNRDPAAAPAPSDVNGFLRHQTFINPGAVDAFQRLSPRDRERLISELIWRVICHLDGSITRVLGFESYPLGRQFCAVQGEKDGRGIFCVSLVE